MPPPPLTIQLFGPLQVTVRDAPLPHVRTRSVEWLLALLTLRHGRAVDRSWLAGTLWPESGGTRALQSLRDDLLRLRQALGPESSRIQSPARDFLTLDLTGAAVDVLQFDAAIQAGDAQSLRRAVALYTGPLLEDCVEEWAFSERAARAEQCLTALETLAERAAAQGDHAEAIRYLRRAETLDPLRDTLPRRLMTSLAAAGDPAAGIQTYRDFRQRLQEQLTAAPDEATTRLFHEIRAAARRPAAQRRLAPTPTLEPASGPPGFPRPTPEPLPLALTSLIGREQEVAQIREALQQGRLVTLVGGGGVGKTRLALEVAVQAGNAMADKAVWVELAPLADGALVLPTVAAAVGLRDEGGPGDADALVRRLVVRLGDGVPLLVLDNCEHVLDAATAMIQLLLQRCPALRVLATSRQRLGLTGEVVWRVPSLPAPDPERLPAAADAAIAATLGFAAVRLFVERAMAVQPGFRLASGAEAVAVAQICCRLDGIPLALELAAARVTALPVAQIAARLDDRFRLLTQGARGVLPRQQTLRALIDWSHDLLTEPERVLLRRLSVFVGGWTLEAAEAVCSDVQRPDDRSAPTDPTNPTQPPERRTPESLNADAVLDLLDALVDRSLVLVDEVAGGLRYRMLETVREYAREKLAGSGEVTAVRDRHRDWFLQLAQDAGAASDVPEQAAWAMRLEPELDNLRTALAWCQEESAATPVGERVDAPPAAEVWLRLATALCGFWLHGGYVAEGLQWLEGALDCGNGLPVTLRASAFFGAPTLADKLGNPEQVRPFLASARGEYEKVLALSRTEANRSKVARTLLRLGDIVFRQSDWDTAWAILSEARPLIEELGDRLALACVLGQMAGIPLERGDLKGARTLLEEHLAICRELAVSKLLMHALGGMGHVAREQDDFTHARRLYRESLLFRRELGNQIAIAQSLEDLAALAGRAGRGMTLDQAVEYALGGV